MNEKNKKNIQNENFLNEIQNKKVLQEKKINNSIINEIDSIKNVKYGLKVIEKTKKKIFNTEKKIQDLGLRYQANIENYDKKLTLELSNIKNEYLNQFFMDFLPFLDLLDDMVILVNKKNKLKDPNIEGIVLTRKLLLKCISKFGIKKIKVTKDSFFDHEQHESDEFVSIKDNSLLRINGVVKQGYLFKDKVLRKAKIKSFK